MIYRLYTLTTFPKISHTQVSALLKTMPSKSSPLDLIPTSLLKSCSVVFAPILANLANLSFSQGSFPSSFKLAQVTPLLKKPQLDPLIPANYRPISNLSTIGKILERLALPVLQNHITSSANFCVYQSAYRSAHSTETAVLKILDDVHKNTDKGHPSLLLTIDLSAAFDTVDHSKLTERLDKDFGVAGFVGNWIKSYITSRTQFIKFEGEVGPKTAVVSGVPQGSVLGPLLFSTYVSPISRIASHFEISQHHYADDTTLYVRLENLSCVTTNLTECVDAMRAWFFINGMQINPDKSEIMVIGTRAQLKKVECTKKDISIGGASVSFSDTVKILGVTLDKHLSFDKHVSEVCQMMNYHIRGLRHIRPHLTVNQASQLGCSIVFSRLDYCNSVLHGTSVHNLNKLQRVQNNLARVVLNERLRNSASPLL